MGLLPNTSNCWCACAGNTGNVFPATAAKQSRHASRHMRDARAVMHAGIANSRFPLNSAAGGNVPGIPGACATRNFTYLVRGPCDVRFVSHVLTISGFMLSIYALNSPAFYAIQYLRLLGAGKYSMGTWLGLYMYNFTEYCCILCIIQQIGDGSKGRTY